MNISSTREELRAVVKQFGHRAVAWFLNDCTPAEMKALEGMSGTPIGDRLGATPLRNFNATQAADLFDMTTNRWLAQVRAGKAPAPVAVGQTERWERETLLLWAASGCRGDFATRAAAQVSSN